MFSEFRYPCGRGRLSSLLVSVLVLPFAAGTVLAQEEEDDEQIEEAYLSGAVDYIQKPIRKTALISKVRVFLDLWQLRHGLELEVEQRRVAEHRVEHLATHDPLTNLPNPDTPILML